MIGLLFLNSYIHFFFFRYVNDDNNDYPFPDRNSVPLFIYKQKLNDISCMYIVRTRVYAAEQLGGRLESIALRVYEPNDKPNVKNQQNVCANSERLFIWSREIKNRIIRNTVTSFDSYRIFDQIKPEEKCENRLNNRTDQFCGFRKNKNFQLSIIKPMQCHFVSRHSQSQYTLSAVCLYYLWMYPTIAYFIFTHVSTAQRTTFESTWMKNRFEKCKLTNDSVLTWLWREHQQQQNALTF